MNNKKAQMGLGSFLMIFVAVIVGLVLFVAIAQTTGSSTTSVTLTNTTYLAAALPDDVNGRIDLVGQDLLSTPIVALGNTTNEGLIIGAGNYTIDEIVSESTGVKTISFRVDDHEIASGNITSLNLTYTYGPDGYVNSSGGRAMVGLIAIFFALGIVAIVLGPVVKEGLGALGN